MVIWCQYRFKERHCGTVNAVITLKRKYVCVSVEVLYWRKQCVWIHPISFDIQPFQSFHAFLHLVLSKKKKVLYLTFKRLKNLYYGMHLTNWRLRREGKGRETDAKLHFFNSFKNFVCLFFFHQKSHTFLPPGPLYTHWCIG